MQPRNLIFPALFFLLGPFEIFFHCLSEIHVHTIPGKAEVFVVDYWVHSLPGNWLWFLNWLRTFFFKDLNVLYQVCVFGQIGKATRPTWPPIDWAIFYFSSESAERNSTNLERMRGQHPLPSFFYFRVIGKPIWPPGFWLVESFSTSPLKPLNDIQGNLRLKDLSQMLHDILGHDHIQWHPQSIRHYTNLRTYYRTGLYYPFWPYYQIL